MTTTQPESAVAEIVDDDWSFEQVKAFLQLTTEYDEAEAFDAAHEIVHA